MRGVPFNETLWPLLMMVTVCASSDRPPSLTCRESTFGMTILKFTLAVAVARAVGAAVCTWDSDAAVSGSNNEAVLITAVGSLPIRAGRAFEASRKLGKTHQNVLVFYNGEPKNLRAHFPEDVPIRDMMAEGDTDGSAS